MSRYKRPSLETILTNTREARSLGDWSMVWSTDNVPGMDNAFGGGRTTMRLYGRRKLRLRSLVIGALLTMHCNVSSAALNGGFFLYIVFLILAVGGLANPMRHFEIYLGQWSINGPGRAFRIVPMLEGIGLAMCINSMVRAICYVSMAAMAAIYVSHTISDARLPYTYCRNEDLQKYEPTVQTYNMVVPLVNRKRYFEKERRIAKDIPLFNITKIYLMKVLKCEDNTSSSVKYTPQYNYFYVELMHYRVDEHLECYNFPLAITMFIIWGLIWLAMITERLVHGRLVWNNVHVGFIAVPWLWTFTLLSVACVHYYYTTHPIQKNFNVNSRDFFWSVSDAMNIALYIHATSIGTSLIFGKGLNHYANGHIDSQLNEENVWFSCIVTALTLLNAGGSLLCSLVDTPYKNKEHMLFGDEESTLWIMPMYSKCFLVGNHSHVLSTVIFGGLAISYGVLAYVMMKTAIHTVFEMRVKFVLIEQTVVAVFICTCMCLSMGFATNTGLAFIEMVDSIFTDVAMPFICFLELVAFIFVYRSHDFMSDLNLATEENTCSTRLDTQWKIIPFAIVASLVMRLILLFNTRMSPVIILSGLAPLLVILVIIPIKACINAYTLRGAPAGPS